MPEIKKIAEKVKRQKTAAKDSLPPAERLGGEGGAEGFSPVTMVNPNAKGGGGKGNRPPYDPARARANAQQMLADCRRKIELVKGDLSQTATDQINGVFGQGENVLSDNWDPKQVFRDALVLLINGYGAVSELYGSLYEHLKPGPKPKAP